MNIHGLRLAGKDLLLGYLHSSPEDVPCLTNLPACPMSCTPHLRTRKAPRKNQSWEMMQYDVSVLPAACFFPHGCSSWLLPQHSPSQHSPSPATTSCSTTGLGHEKFTSAVQELCPERGSPLLYASPPLLSQSFHRTFNITAKISAWMLQSVGRQHEEGPLTTLQLSRHRTGEKGKWSHLSQHQMADATADS